MGVTKAMFSTGYCLNPDCSDYAKSVFLSVLTTKHVCYRCQEVGHAETEKHWPLRYDSLEFNQVRLEFRFDCIENRYRGLVVITDESKDKASNVWYIQNPNIIGEKQGKKVATDVLGFLQRADKKIFEPDIVLRNTEIILDFDRPMPDFKAELARLETLLGGSRLCLDRQQM